MGISKLRSRKEIPWLLAILFLNEAGMCYQTSTIHVNKLNAIRVHSCLPHIKTERNGLSNPK